MTVSITTTPSYPVPKRAFKLVPAVSGAGNFARIWVTGAPTGSEWKRKIDLSRAGRTLFWEGAITETPSFTLDIGGAYTLAAQEYTKGATNYGGGYERAADANQTEAAVGAENALSLYIGERLETLVGPPGHQAQLALWVWNDTIRETTLNTHGEHTPALYTFRSSRARLAGATSAVRTALQAFLDTAASTLNGDPAAVLDGLITDFNDVHAPSGTFHSSADADNPVDPGFKNTGSEASLARAATQFAVKFSRHATNDNGNGPGSADYHQNDYADWANTPEFTAAGNRATTLSLIGLLLTRYQAHLPDASAHGSPDSYSPGALPKLLSLHQAFAAAVYDTATAPATSNSGAALLVLDAGFEMVPGSAVLAGQGEIGET